MSKENLLETLKDESDSEHVAYIEFMNSYSKNNDNTLYCFFEGDEDKRYYGIRIKHLAKKIFIDFSCKGKEKVKGVKKLIENRPEYKKSPNLYFLDKDFSSDTTEKNIYVTPCYSVENFYSSEETFSEVMKNEFNMKKEDEDFNRALKLFKELQNLFHEEIKTLNAWLACQYELKDQRDKIVKLNIDGSVRDYLKNIVKDDLVNIKDISKLKDVDFIEKELFSKCINVSRTELEKKIDEFNTSNPSCIYRGKFELIFMVSFLGKLKNEIGKQESTIFKERHSTSFVFDIKNAISTLSNYAETPACLEIFLENYTSITNNSS